MWSRGRAESPASHRSDALRSDLTQRLTVEPLLLVSIHQIADQLEELLVILDHLSGRREDQDLTVLLIAGGVLGRRAGDADQDRGRSLDRIAGDVGGSSITLI